MKIIQMIFSLGNGGVEKFCVELSNTLAKKNQVILSTFKPVEDWMNPPRSLSPEVALKEFNFPKHSLRI
jgi:hypothetical protein